MDVMITKDNGDSFTLEDIGVVVRDFNVSSIPIEPVYGSGEGRHGTIDYGATYGTRTISVPFYFKSRDTMDYPLLRDELFALVSVLKPFYIRELRRDTFQDGENSLVGGKRYLVRLSDGFNVEQTFEYGFGELTFETTELPFAESDETKAQFSDNSFRLVYEGNVALHPFEQALKITIKNVRGSTTYLQLRNKTNGSLLRITEGVTQSQSIVMDGANITSNNLQFLRKTTRKYIELSVGDNDFEITGATSADVTFEYVNYYL